MSFDHGVRPPERRERELWFAVVGSRVIAVADSEGKAAGFPGTPPVPAGEPHYLGALDDAHCFAYEVDTELEAPAGHAVTDLRALWSRVPEELWAVAGKAVQIVDWDRTHRYCGQCGTLTERVDADRSRRCPACNLSAYPRLAPAVIAVVERGDELLLAHGTRFPAPFYSALAGFVEPGESLEGAVVREIREEVGIEVDDVRYFGSQPWPFPHSLMIGFHARWAGGEIRIDPEEIADAQFFAKDDLPLIPPPMSIARSLIDAAVARRG
jgi:NAD+ diphosphatase